MKEASLQATKLLLRTLLSKAIVGSSLGALDVLGALKDKALKQHLSGDSGILDVLTQSKLIVGFDAQRDFPMMASALADQAKVNAEKVIAAAAIVLSHSLADDVFTEACKIAIDLDPEEWTPELTLEKTFPLKTLKEKGIDNLLADELKRFSNGLKNSSLPSRARLLFRHVPIDHHTNVGTDENYFKMKRLKELDDLRHGLVHHNGLPNIDPVKGSPAAIFLHEAAHTALRSLANAYGLTLDKEYVRSIISPEIQA